MQMILLAELLAQTERLRIVATFNGCGNLGTFWSDLKGFELVGGSEISSSIAAFRGTICVGNELQAIVWALFRFRGAKRKDDRKELFADLLKAFVLCWSFGEVDISCL